MRIPREEYKRTKEFLGHASKGNIECVKNMIYNGEVNIFCVKPVSDSAYRKDALFFAIKNERIELADYLVKIGMNPKEYGNGIVRMVAHKGRFKSLDFLIKNGWSKDEIIGIGIGTLLGDKTYTKLAKFSSHMKIADPIEYAIKHWKSQLSKVTDEYRPILEERIKDAPRIRRELKIISITEIV